MRSRKNDDAFSAFFAVEQQPLQRFATFMCGDRDLAADLAQEALARTYAAWARTRDPAAYARRIVVNAVRDQRRKAVVRRLRPVDEPASTSESRETATLEKLSVAEMLQKLSPSRRAVVVLRFYEDMTEPQIAALLERPLGTVKSDLHRALDSLRPLAAEERQDAGGTRGY